MKESDVDKEVIGRMRTERKMLRGEDNCEELWIL